MAQEKEIAKEAEKQAKIEAEAAEEERLAKLRKNAVVGNQRIVETLERIKELEQEIADLKRVGITEGYKDYDNRVQELERLKQEVRDYNNGVDNTKKNYGKLGKVTKSVFGFIGEFFKNSKSQVSSFGNTIKKLGGFLSTFATRFKSLAFLLLIFNQITKVFNAMISGIKQGFQNLALYSNQTNADISMLISSLLQLKNSLATAFAPILTVVVPILKSFISLLSQATTYVSHLMSALTSKSTYIRAIEVQKDYADSLKAIGEAAKDAAGSLSAYDKINPIQDKNSGGGGDGGRAEINPGDMFETVDIESSVSNFAQKIKDAWINADFTEIGTILGIKLKNALDSIKWEPIKETAEKIGASIGTLINGFIETNGLAYSIGKTIREAINTGIAGINAFLDNTH